MNLKKNMQNCNAKSKDSPPIFPKNVTKKHYPLKYF